MWRAIFAGQLIVNVPSACIIIAVAFMGRLLVPWEVALISGALLAWIWWSFNVTRWRAWAIRKGCDPERLQKFAVRTGLTWPKGSVLEKTEFHTKN